MPNRWTTWQRCAAVAVLAIGVAAAAAPAAARTSDPYAPTFDPASFVDRVDNPYFPLVPGSRWVYAGTTDAGKERVVTEVADQTQDILGVAATVVHDDGYVDGKLIERTTDWYAQDRAGNVWYLGEDTHEIKDGVEVSTKGSWKAGVDGARAGIIMPAQPRVGQTYRQEYLKGKAEDMATVLAVRASDIVPFVAFRDAVRTKDFSPLEPRLVEHKFYAPDIGIVLEKTLKGGFGRLELVEYTKPTATG
jgi:hypothetical protein